MDTPIECENFLVNRGIPKFHSVFSLSVNIFFPSELKQIPVITLPCGSSLSIEIFIEIFDSSIY